MEKNPKTPKTEYKSVKDKYEDGELIFLRAIYDVDFKPIFEIEDNLGKIAKKLQEKFKDVEIEISIDKSKESQAVKCMKKYKHLMISRSNFRIVKFISDEEMVIDPQEIEQDINAMIKIISKNVLQDKQLQEITDVKRIGVRFLYAINRRQPHILKHDLKNNFFSSHLISNFFEQKDKLYYLKTTIGPELEDGKNSSSEKTLELSIPPMISLEDHIAGTIITLEHPAVIDYIEGYSNVKKISIDYYNTALNNLIINILEIFEKKE
jgi:hypothetical protein